jgi:hypothetical protein
MRAVFGVLSLLIVVAIVAVLVRKQLGAVAPIASPAAPAQGDMARPEGSPRQQVEQFQRAVQDSLQPARAMPDEK